MALAANNNNNHHHPSSEMQEPSIDSDKLSYEIFSILENKFLFGYHHDDQKLWLSSPRVHPNNLDFSTSTPPLSPSPQPSSTPVTHNTTTSIKTQRGKICILSIDGGGMRNIISGNALSYLEHALKVKSGNQDARIADYIDVVAGSGIGGIFAAMLFATKDGSRPLFQADDTWRFLAEKGRKIYRPLSSSSSFKRLLQSPSGAESSAVRKSTESLEKLMKESFSSNGGNGTPRHLTLKDTVKPVLIPCYDLTSTAPFVFSRADAIESDGFDFKLWEVCRASAAEPGVFEPVKVRSTDGATSCVAVSGGVAVSNPTAAAITHVLHNKQEFPFVRGVEDIMVISIGTGQLLEDGKTSYEFEKVKAWKGKQWARPLARIAGDGHADSVDHAVSMAFRQCRSGNYVRIQANGSTSGRCGLNMDTDPSPENVKTLVGIAEEMLKQKNVESILFGGKRIGEQSNIEKMDWFAGELVLEHQRRSCRIAPTVALKQSPPPPSQRQQKS